MVGTAILFDLQPLLALRDIGPEQAAEAVGAWSVAMAVMAIPSGRLVDRAKPAWILVAGTVAVASSCLLLWRTAENAVVALVVYAVGQSLNASAVGATTARFFGRAHHGAIRSSMARIAVIGTGLGPLVFGASHHLTGSYDAALMAFALLCAPVALAAVALREPVAA